MSGLVQKILEGENFAVCTRDLSGRVVEQNAECLRYCGNMKSQVCTKGCIEHYSKLPASRGEQDCLRVLSLKPLHGGVFDILFLRSKHYLTTIFHPVYESIVKPMEALSGFKLTSREMQVAKHMLQGFTNQEISRKLGISKSTLKTHINRVYQKLGDRSDLLPTRR